MDMDHSLRVMALLLHDSTYPISLLRAHISPWWLGPLTVLCKKTGGQSWPPGFVPQARSWVVSSGQPHVASSSAVCLLAVSTTGNSSLAQTVHPSKIISVFFPSFLILTLLWHLTPWPASRQWEGRLLLSFPHSVLLKLLFGWSFSKCLQHVQRFWEM